MFASAMAHTRGNDNSAVSHRPQSAPSVPVDVSTRQQHLDGDPVFVSNPYPRTKLHSQYRRVTTTPRAVTALSRTFGRRLNPRKFSRQRWSQARAWAGILFAISLVYVCFRGRRHYVNINVRGEKLESESESREATVVRHAIGLHRDQKVGSPMEEHPVSDPTRSPNAVQGHFPDRQRYSKQHRYQNDNQKHSSEPLAENPSEESKFNSQASGRKKSDLSSTGLSQSNHSQEVHGKYEVGEVENSLPNEIKNYATSIDRDFPMDVATKITESLRKDINEELEGAGEESIPKRKIKHEKSSRRDSHHPSGNKEQKPSHHGQTKGFAAQVARQNLVQDAVHINTANPWQELSGARGPYYPDRNDDAEDEDVSPAVEMWSHRDVPASQGFKFPFCRLYGACRTKSGRILLSKSLKEQKAKLARCGILSNGNFVLGDEKEEAAYDFIQDVEGVQVSDMDLVERHAPRRGAAHFLADSLKVLFFIDATHGAGAKNQSLLQKSCIDSSGDRPGPCIGESSAKIHPVMFVRKESFVDDVWVPHYMKLLAKSSTMGGKSPLRFLNQYSLYPSSSPGKPEAAACFRSITTSAYMYGQIPPSAFTAANPFFSGNGISRTPVHPMKGGPSQLDPSTDKKVPCRLRVKLSDHLTGDSANNLHEMTRLLKEKTRKAKGESNISIMLVLPAKETVPFETQVKRTQEADILVAPHMLPFTDIIFMRPGGGVIELHPFAYISGMFQGMSHQLGLSHSKLSAEPDVKLFHACIQRYNTGPEADAIPQLIAKMEAAAEQYKATGRIPMRFDVASRDFRLLREIKLCARRQRMRLNPAKLADEIWSRAKRVCSQ